MCKQFLIPAIIFYFLALFLKRIGLKYSVVPDSLVKKGKSP